MISICNAIVEAGGMAYRSNDRFMVVIPEDGQWIVATASDLGIALEAARESDGRASDDGDVVVRPHLTVEDAIDEACGWSDEPLKLLVQSPEIVLA